MQHLPCLPILLPASRDCIFRQASRRARHSLCMMWGMQAVFITHGIGKQVIS